MKPIVLCMVFVLAVFFIGFLLDYISDDTLDDLLIAVEVKGQVKFPGMYYIVSGSNWSLVLDKCGGTTDLALMPDNFDYNAPITEDSILVVPRKYFFRKNVYEEN